VFTRPIFPSPDAPGWNGSALGFTSSFAPRRHPRRTSTWGQVIEHGPGPTLYVIDVASIPALISQCVRPHVARDKGETAVEEMEAAGRALNEEPGASEVGHPISASADCNRIGALVALSSPSEACASRTGRCSRDGAPPKSSPGAGRERAPLARIVHEPVWGECFGLQRE
jgi:hypothetical protein